MIEINIVIEDENRVLQAFAHAYNWPEETEEMTHSMRLKQVLVDQIKNQVTQNEESRALQAALSSLVIEPVTIS